MCWAKQLKKQKVEDPAEARFDAMMELIKDLPRADYKLYPLNNNYLISSCGKIYSINYNHTGKIKELKQFKNNKGYYFTSIYYKNEKKQRSELVHRIVARTFLEGYSDKKEVNHKDGNPKNNDVNNLEWVTRSENEFHKNRVLEHRKKGTRVLCIETGEIFDSYHSAGRAKNIYAQNIYRVVKKHGNTCGGYHWREYENI